MLVWVPRHMPCTAERLQVRRSCGPGAYRMVINSWVQYQTRVLQELAAMCVCGLCGHIP